MDRELFTGFMIVIAAAALGGWVANPFLGAAIAGSAVVLLGSTRR